MGKISKIKMLRVLKRGPAILNHDANSVNNLEHSQKEMQSLLPRQRSFVSEYLVDLNGEQAAIRAGYSRSSAATQACRQLKKRSIRYAIEIEMNKRQRRIAIDQDKVIFYLEKMRQAAYCAGKYSAAVKCSELQGRHLGKFVDRALLGDDRDYFNLENAQKECLDTLRKLVPEYDGTYNSGDKENDYE
jgi:hypothetical protein